MKTLRAQDILRIIVFGIGITCTLFSMVFFFLFFSTGEMYLIHEPNRLIAFAELVMTVVGLIGLNYYMVRAWHQD